MRFLGALSRGGWHRPRSFDKPSSIEEGAFPADGAPEERLRFLLRYAMLAPSRYNTQPWLFWIQDDTVGLRIDSTRALPVVDPQKRELTMSCGAAVLHLRLAAHHFGYEVEVKPFPNRWNPDLVALARLGRRQGKRQGERQGESEEPTEEERLFGAMFSRRTNRMPFEEREVPEGVLCELQTAASEEGARLLLLKDKNDKEKVAQLIYEGSRLQWSDGRFRRELGAWVRPNRTNNAPDGMPGGAVGLGEIMSQGWPALAGAFNPGHDRAANDRRLALEAPVLAVLATEGNARADWLLAGQALAKVLLTGRTEGVSASFLSQPVEVPELRPRLVETLGTPHHPQVILRMGYGPEATPTPRRHTDGLSIGY